jgi:hypothetical protein
METTRPGTKAVPSSFSGSHQHSYPGSPRVRLGSPAIYFRRSFEEVRDVVEKLFLDRASRSERGSELEIKNKVKCEKNKKWMVENITNVFIYVPGRLRFDVWINFVGVGACINFFLVVQSFTL